MMRLLPLLLVLVTACTSTPGSGFPEQWQSSEITTASERILWEVTVLSLQKHDFPVGTGVDPTTMEAVTGWQNNLAPFRGQGYRQRAHVRYEVVGPQRYKVSVRIEHQLNMDVSRPLDARYAKWESGQDDVDQAGVILQRIKAWIGGEFDVGDESRPGS
jgi:hypothetical protein